MKESDNFKYMMSIEKIVNLVFVAEGTLELMLKYEIVPDNLPELRRILLPILEDLTR